MKPAGAEGVLPERDDSGVVVVSLVAGLSGGSVVDFVKLAGVEGVFAESDDSVDAVSLVAGLPGGSVAGFAKPDGLEGLFGWSKG